MQTPEDFQAELRQEFIDAASDELYTLEEKLKEYAENPVDGDGLLSLVRRTAHSLKGRGGTFDFPVITIVAHRLEDFLSNVSNMTKNDAAGVQMFVDRMHQILEVTGTMSADDTAKIVRELPTRHGEFDPNTVSKMDIEVLLVMPKGAATHFVERELQACGYRVVNITTAFTAMEMAVRTRPDLVLINMTMEGLAGVDLANAFQAMTATNDIPVALLTSMNRTSAELQALNKDVPVVRKGAVFGDDLAAALAQLKIT